MVQKHLQQEQKEASAGVDQLVDTLKNTPDSIQKNIDEVIDQVKKHQVEQSLLKKF